MSGGLTYRGVPRGSLTTPQIDRMFELMEANYDLVSLSNFRDDLSWKDEILLLLDGDGVIQGFSTLALNPAGTGSSEYDILFSGDTIIAPAHWGSQELVRAFCQTAGRHYARSGKPLFWYLLSKGYRTYLYMPLFTHAHFPMSEPPPDEGALRSIADRCSRLMFGDAWKPDRGVLQFPNSRGQLKPELAADAALRSHNPRVAFFLKRNPGFARGDELVCVAELSPENTRRSARRFFLEGMEIATPKTIGAAS